MSADQVQEQTAVEETAKPVETAEKVEATDGKSTERGEKGRFRSPLQPRIDELTRAKHEALREADYWKMRATANEQKEAEAKQAQESKKPVPADFESYDAYVDELTRYNARQLLKEQREADSKTRDEEKRVETARQRQQKFREQIEATTKDIPDFDDAIASAANVAVADHVTELMEESDLGARLLYHFAKNPTVVDRLNAMSATAAAREIGRIEAGILAAAKPPEPEVEEAEPEKEAKPAPIPATRQTKAPPPAKPLSSGRSTVVDLSKLSGKAYAEARKAQGARWAR